MTSDHAVGGSIPFGRAIFSGFLGHSIAALHTNILRVAWSYAYQQATRREMS